MKCTYAQRSSNLACWMKVQPEIWVFDFSEVICHAGLYQKLRGWAKLCPCGSDTLLASLNAIYHRGESLAGSIWKVSGGSYQLNHSFFTPQEIGSIQRRVWMARGNICFDTTKLWKNLMLHAHALLMANARVKNGFRFPGSSGYQVWHMFGLCSTTNDHLF